MEQCQKESQRHGFCSKHLSQLREPNAFSQQMQRLVGAIGSFPHAAALPFLAEYYQRRFEYGPLSAPLPPPPPPPPSALSSLYHPIGQVSNQSAGLNAMRSLGSFSTPASPSTTTTTTTKALLVNTNQSPSAFISLLPMGRQHSVDITSPPSSSSSTPVLSNNTDSSRRRSSDDDDEDDDSEVDIESLSSPGG